MMDVLANCLKISHKVLERALKKGDVVIDATAGNGYDTEFLSKLVGETGVVHAFDIQEMAIRNLEFKIKEKNINNIELYLQSHADMKRVLEGKNVQTGSVSAVVFNLGYLPGGDHSIATRYETTIAAIKQSLSLLKTSGIITLMIYSGGDTGYEEKNEVLEYLYNLENRSYKVLKFDFINQPNDPPILVVVEKR